MTHLNTLLIELVTQEQRQETKGIVAKLSFLVLQASTIRKLSINRNE